MFWHGLFIHRLINHWKIHTVLNEIISRNWHKLRIQKYIVFHAKNKQFRIRWSQDLNQQPSDPQILAVIDCATMHSVFLIGPRSIRIVYEQAIYFWTLHGPGSCPLQKLKSVPLKIWTFLNFFLTFWTFFKLSIISKMHFEVSNHTQKFQKNWKQIYYISWLQAENLVARIASKI